VQWIGGCECGSLHALVRPDGAGLGIRKLASHDVVVGQWLVPHEMHVTSLYIHDRCFYEWRRLRFWRGGGSAGVNAGLYMRLCVRIALASEGIRKLAPHHVVVGQWRVPHEMHVTSLYTRSVLLALPSGPSQPPPLCAVRIGGCECGSLHALVRPDRAGLGI
jgi:hypothetical protein